MTYRYREFEDWFHEMESYGFKSERFYDEILTLTPEQIIEWLRSAWDCSRMKDEYKHRLR